MANILRELDFSSFEMQALGVWKDGSSVVEVESDWAAASFKRMLTTGQSIIMPVVTAISTWARMVVT